MKTIIFLLIIFTFNFQGCTKRPKNQVNKNSQTNAEKYYLVTKIFDGDTFEVIINNKMEKIRLLGIDTPEKWLSNKLKKDSERSGNDQNVIRRLGELASKYTDSVLLGKKVILKPDPTNSDTDRYGRLLRYCYLEDGTFFNLQIIKDGYANAYTKYPIIYMDEFLKAQNEARVNNRGLWRDYNFSNMN